MVYQNFQSMEIKVSKQAQNSVIKLGLTKQFKKQINLFKENGSRYPSLNFELLNPKRLKIYSFRVNKKYRAKLIRTTQDSYFVVDVIDYH